MKEIGGYIELDTYNLPLLHEGAIALNCGRNCLAYLIRAKNIKKMAIPKFLCSSIDEVCERENVKITHYSIDINFKPMDLSLENDEWLYLVNYYGQMTNSFIKETVDRYGNVIVDNAQAYYQLPLEKVDTLYTCRKFFGVTDGAFLYTDIKLDEDFPIDESHDRFDFILGRYERTASEFYSSYSKNNKGFKKEPIKKMSKLTDNLLRAIDYERIKHIRTRNFVELHSELEKINKLNLIIPEGAFMYPLYIENGKEIRKRLIQKKIYIPLLWEDTFRYCKEDELEYDMANNILPLPIDQRYSSDDMKYIISEVLKCLNYEN